MSLQRDAYTKTVTDLLLQELNGKGVILDNVLIRNVEPPTIVSDAIAAKLKASQESATNGVYNTVCSEGGATKGN